MPDLATLFIFIPTFFFVSITPGMCMSLSMTLGMTVGIKRTFWMMLGEVIGVALVAVLSLVGVASIFIAYPNAFIVFKWVGGAYLLFIGIKLYFTPVHISLDKSATLLKRSQLIIQGFVTAIANPKGWAFMIALLPPFIDPNKSFSIQTGAFVTIIMLSEFICMCIYASGGKSLNAFLNKSDQRQWVNRIGGALLAMVGIWLALS